MIKFICAFIVVIFVSTYGMWLNVKGNDKKQYKWELTGVCLAIIMVLATFFSALYMIMFFVKTVWGMI